MTLTWLWPSWPSPDLHLTFIRPGPGPGPELDKSFTSSRSILQKKFVRHTNQNDLYFGQNCKRIFYDWFPNFPNSFHSSILFKCFSYLFTHQYLAILFFQKDYKSFWDDLPGVEDDEKELTEVLKSYQKRVANNSEDVLKDLRKILQDNKQKEFKRIHFHFSGRIYCTRKSPALVSNPTPYHK